MTSASVSATSSKHVELPPLLRWQTRLAREVAAGKGLNALSEILAEIKAAQVDNEADLLDAMRKCADRHLTPPHDVEVVDAVFDAVFHHDGASEDLSGSPDLNRKLDATTINNDAETEIQRLSELPIVQYERERVAVAERLGMRASALDAAVKAARPQDSKGQGRSPSIVNAEPWGSPVNLADVLDEAVAQYRHYLILPDGGAEKMALWSLMTHCFERFAIVPRLAVTAADKECAKSLVLRILKVTSARAVMMTNANIAPLFRIISSHRPSIFLDEADNYIHENPQLLAMLNDGYAAGGCVWRCEGDNNEVKEFDVFAPVAIAMIERPPATLLSRSIEIRMKRKRPDEKTTNFRGDRVDSALKDIQQKFARAAIDLAETLRRSDPDMGILFNRDADNWRPMFAIADLAGAGWSARIRKIAKDAVAEKAEQSVLDKLLTNIQWIFDGCPAKDGKTATEPPERMASAQLVEQLVKIEGAPWADYKGGKPITPGTLARLLGRLSIVSDTIRFGSTTAKGYYRTSFEDAFARHLPPQNVTASQPNNDGHCYAFQCVTPIEPVTLPKTSQPNNDGHCYAVTLSTPETTQMAAIDL
jgi:hypothetical protein